MLLLSFHVSLCPAQQTWENFWENSYCLLTVWTNVYLYTYKIKTHISHYSEYILYSSINVMIVINDIFSRFTIFYRFSFILLTFYNRTYDESLKWFLYRQHIGFQTEPKCYFNVLKKCKEPEQVFTNLKLYISVKNSTLL